MTYRVGGIDFPTKKAVTEHARVVLRRWPPKLPIFGPDEVFIRDLLTHHPFAEDKIGAGLSGVFIGLGEYGHRHFNFRRVDGTVDNFSIKQCVGALR
ncbi:hypothetical protein CAPI_01625 [Corynebacterium capitovis DSM 44611]|uniref:DUF3223 domain-containing protein n=1 Tax=Corynebacterium capitovis TaxID=131081 RepID=UPI000381F4B8|nr:DUF3223 domain-containing protein [Corynebacterium capitovis]WKD56899.1 hypothetical protein CAPI_01625 [Corynebacterium capitovis DSM 44611]